jgi:thioredoxin reductase (NADPH)
MTNYDVIIIGSGPAAYTAGIYSGRARLSTLILEGPVPGGQLLTTTTIENYPGFIEIDGFELVNRMADQAVHNNCILKSLAAVKVEKNLSGFSVTDSNNEIYTSKSVILAMGAEAKKLEFVNSSKFWNKGISACAVCDGACPIFRDQVLCVVGGGDSAMEEALFLTKFASKVIILVRSNRLRASAVMIERVKANEKIEIQFNKEVLEASSDEKDDENLRSIVIVDNITNEKSTIDCRGLFYAIGHKPNTEIIAELVEIKDNFYIKKFDNSTKTNIPGIFSAGDISDDIYRQAITAAGNGCMAALDCIRWLEH